ncbi:MAG: hypothetical protein ACLFPL_02430 [Candidatus Nanoarchaeia archaeon]
MRQNIKDNLKLGALVGSLLIGGGTYLVQNDPVSRITEQIYSAHNPSGRGIEAHVGSSNSIKREPSKLEEKCGVTFESITPKVIDGLSQECHGYVVDEGYKQNFP